MKKLLLLVLAAALIAAGAWVLIRNSANEALDGQHSVRGYIFAVEDTRILIAEGLAQGVAAYTGSFEELTGAAYWFAIDADTRLTDERGAMIRLESLQLNDEVEVVAAGPVMDSYPAQGTAWRIQLTGERYVREEARFDGYVFAIEDARFLLAERLAPGVSEYTGELEELQGSAVWFRWTESTEVTGREGEPQSIDAVSVGSGVEVYTTGPLLLSYPAQGGADRIVLTGEAYDPAGEEVFSETGNLMRDNPGFTPGVWYVSFEAPGQPALAQALVFDGESRCVSGMNESVCDPETFEQGSRALVEGVMTDDGVRVETLTWVGR
jgi:hypothetical protein